ncbi:hypothetical protein M9Y10_039600, partial [Tritrichomonas musculus]
ELQHHESTWIQSRSWYLSEDLQRERLDVEEKISGPAREVLHQGIQEQSIRGG